MGWDDVERFAEPIDSLLSADELTLLGQYRQLDLNDRVKLLEYSITLGLISKGINLKDV